MQNLTILNKDFNLPLINRLLKIRWLLQEKETFLNPTWKSYWYDPFTLTGMDKSVQKILKTIKNNDRIVIFGDYDVDGITATYIVFYFFYKFLNYKNISIRLPSRQDWYWIRTFHLDELKKKNVKLLITVDNGITAIKEIEYWKKLWIDTIITDHHTPLNTIPNAYAIINPKISYQYPFKELAWVGVAFKLISAIIKKININKELKQKILNYFLPIVTIWTIADCVPLINENRLLVKKWLDIINNQNKIPPNLQNIIKYLNLKYIDSYHIWFILWPRLNASWRVYKPYDSFFALYQHNLSYQIKYIEQIEKFNNERKIIQDKILKEIENTIDLSKNILVAYWEFHEWIIWIVSWRLTEKYNKPSIVISINKEENKAIGSCRSPSYFSTIDMLEYIWKTWIFERFWWHKQAWWFTIEIDKLNRFIQYIYEYWKNISWENLKKTIFIDTEILEKDLLSNDINLINKLSPFGEWNPEPVFLIKDIKIKKIDIVWKQQNHLKIYWQKWNTDIVLLKRSWANTIDEIKNKEVFSTIVNYSKDNYNWWYYFKINSII